VLAKANLGSQTFGLRTVLAKANLLSNGIYHYPSPEIRDCEPERFSVQARNDNEEDRVLKGV